MAVKYTEIDYDGQKIKIKQYLSLSEIQLVASKMLEADDVFERETMRRYYIMKLCTDVDVSDKEFNIDDAVESGLYDEVEVYVANFYDISDMVKAAEDMPRAIGKFLASVESKIPDEKQQKKLLADIKKIMATKKEV